MTGHEQPALQAPKPPCHIRPRPFVYLTVAVPEMRALAAPGKRESRSGGCCTLATQVYSCCLDARSSRDAACSSLALQCLAASRVPTNASKGSIASHRRLMVIIVTMLRRLHSKPFVHQDQIQTTSGTAQRAPKLPRLLESDTLECSAGISTFIRRS